MKKKQYTAPVSLGGLFPNSDDEDGGEFCNETDIFSVKLADHDLKIRQMAWHGANANQIWPGSYPLVEFLLENTKYSSGKFLELGSATGAVAIALIKAKQLDIVTSDIDDEGVVQENIAWNFTNNGVEPVRHIAHTWGTGWRATLNIRFLIASDILLYVSAYDALVSTLCEIFSQEPQLEEFVMSWNRRIAESEQFFAKMRDQGFLIATQGKGLYVITKPKEA